MALKTTWSWILFMMLYILNVQAQEKIPVITGPDRSILILGFEGNMQERNTEEGQAVLLPPAIGSKKLIYKSRDMGRTYDLIGESSFPSSSAELEERLEAEGLVQDVLSHLEVSNTEQAYQLLSTLGLDTLGLALIQPELSQLFGLSFIDHHPGNQSSAYYKVEYINSQAEVTQTLFADTRDYEVDWAGRLTVQEYLPLDSSITIIWGGEEFMNSQQLPLLGQIYKRTGHQGEFQHIEQVVINTNSETGMTSIGFSESIEPHQHYAYYIQVEDFVGNIGERSDTLSFYAFDTGNLRHIENFSVQDSSLGLHLTWDSLPKHAVYSAIQILKSRQLGSDYVVLDTISSRATEYLDRQVVPSTNYFYKIRPLIFQIPGEDHLLFSEASGHHKGDQLPPPQRPHRPQVMPSTEGIRVSWTPGSELNLFAYYLLRGQHPDAMEIVSDAIQDTVYLDTTFSSDFSGQLHYALLVMDQAQQWSDTSDFSSIRVEQFRVIPAPSGIQSSHGAIGARIAWEDSRARDPRIVGYHVYRKRITDEYFTRLTETSPLTRAFYEDQAIQRDQSYQYGVTSVDAWGHESLMSPLSKLDREISAKLALPGTLNLRNLRSGIEISWPIPVQWESGVQYRIYRRADSEENSRFIAVVDPDQVYVDQETLSGTLYHYSLSVIYQQEEGTISHEQSLRRNE